MDDIQIPPRVDLPSLNVISVTGRGAKGVVFLVQNTSTNQTLALKAISKSSIKSKNADPQHPFRRILFERDVLISLKHPLLPSFYGFIETDKIFGFLIDFCPGGDLASLRRRQTEQMFSDELIRFYAAEIVLALEYLHKHGIVYRDLKPDNILIQDSGHIMLVDFDLSIKLPAKTNPIRESNPSLLAKNNSKKRISRCSCFSFNSGISPEIPESVKSNNNASMSNSGKSNSFVGTEEYVAPEIIKGNGHDFGVDWWSLGVVMYEMLYGRTPFRGQNRKETFYRILSKETELVGERTALRDLVGRLLEKDVEKRAGLEEIKRHEFFRGVNWEEILCVERAPFLPGGVELEKRGSIVIDVEEYVEEVFGGRKEKSEVGVGNNYDGSKKEFELF